MLGALFGLDYRRRRLAMKAPPGPLRDYLEHPSVERRRDYRQVEYLALDLETTGLDPAREDILSVGLVVVRGTRIDLSTARHELVRARRRIPQASAVIHQITDDRAATGKPLEEILPWVLRELTGRVMIAHHARVEMGFLSAACRLLYGTPALFPAVDTQAIALRTFRRRNQEVAAEELRLHALRLRYGLPRYPAHDALSDALAAAELFVAQAAHRDNGKGMALKEFLLQR